MDALSELRALSDLIKNSIETVETVCKRNGQPYPSSHAPFTMASEAIRIDPEISQAGTTIVAAASQLIVAVRPPPLTLVATALQYHVSSSLGTVLQLNVAEILRSAGPQGLHVGKIASLCNTDPTKLARLLRLLCTTHIFTELAPDVFTHNRISSMLDTGKPLETITASPDAKHDGTLSVSALLEHMTDESLKSSAFLVEVMKDPETAKSGEPNCTPFNRAFGTDLPGFAWFERPENRAKLVRFGIGMEGARNMAKPGNIYEGFKWEDLPQGALVVDVGGGIGSQSLALAKKYDRLQFLVQDRAPVIAEAHKFWQREMPLAIESGKVKLHGHDFLSPQPVKDAAVFLLRMILHDSSDAYCVRILQHLRQAAKANTQLVVVDSCLSYACEDSTIASTVPGNDMPRPPKPLLANGGQANIISYLSDLQMLTLLNGSERTVAQFADLFEQSGWKLARVHHGVGFAGLNSKFIGIPA
ncbi:S-adenosyl-L-methionine-dependent methyltransferase [Gloeophyllum trabeum ATCC 11539]|uniref:S-adenosyl-L-methionine-dependent methyltransferase n=1 Tax=Gloeophyllum trabeum (strain ATCC 11539 / FP-39264 / Madison 617) TaxID=670483 RepID=S7QII9_GLOTA|nr:S-adenosyl-L-methionine-dependent methyltransferase [Gloeophyllum trabeum ATCC 11539]EPQ59057.1 S-adenosyl-L-methionine-dependent methyltransferase [Gloeophyllum trabeum ATCC 11539]